MNGGSLLLSSNAKAIRDVSRFPDEEEPSGRLPSAVCRVVGARPHRPKGFGPPAQSLYALTPKVKAARKGFFLKSVTFFDRSSTPGYWPLCPVSVRDIFFYPDPLLAWWMGGAG